MLKNSLTRPGGAIFDSGILDDYLDERGELLPDDERALVERWRETPLAPYEVTQVQPGVSATLRSMSDGASVRLLDRSLSRSVQRLDLLVGRVLDDGDGPCLLALPLRVDRTRRRALLELFDGGYEPEEVAAFFGPQPPPVLQDREGHSLMQCAATFDVPDAEAAWERLGAELDEDGPDRLIAVRELEAGESAIRGSVLRQGVAARLLDHGWRPRPGTSGSGASNVATRRFLSTSPWCSASGGLAIVLGVAFVQGRLLGERPRAPDPEHLPDPLPGTESPGVAGPGLVPSSRLPRGCSSARQSASLARRKPGVQIPSPPPHPG